VALRWVQSGPGPKGFFFKDYFAAYQQVHPNIAIHLDELPWPEIGKIVPLGVQSGTAPDVFQIPTNVTAGQAVQQGWVRPLDDVIPDFAQWKAAFPPGSFLDGVHVFNDKTYTFPFISNKLYGTLLYYWVTRQILEDRVGRPRSHRDGVGVPAGDAPGVSRPR